MARAGDTLALTARLQDGVGGLAVVVACHLENGGMAEMVGEWW